MDPVTPDAHELNDKVIVTAVSETYKVEGLKGPCPSEGLGLVNSRTSWGVLLSCISSSAFQQLKFGKDLPERE